MLYPSTFWPPFHGDLRWPRSYRALVPYWYFANIFRIADMLHFADHAAMFQEFSSAHAAIGYAGFEGCSKNHRPCSQARSQGPLASLPYMFRSSMHEGAQKQASQAASGSQRHMGVAIAYIGRDARRSVVRPPTIPEGVSSCLHAQHPALAYSFIAPCSVSCDTKINTTLPRRVDKNVIR